MQILANFESSGHPKTPDHIDKLTRKPWSKKASAQVDQWLNYVSIEFEGVKP